MRCVRPSDVRLDAGHAAIEAGPVAACAGGSRRCHIAHWLRGSRRDHVRHHRGLLLGVEQLLVNMAAMLVDVMAAMVTEGKRQRHPLLVDLVGRISLRHASGSLGGGLSLCRAGGRLEERVVRRPIGEETLRAPGQGHGGVQTVVVGGRRGGGAAVAKRSIRAHCENISIGPLVQHHLPLPISVGQAQPPQVGVRLRLTLRNAVWNHVLIGVLTT